MNRLVTKTRWRIFCAAAIFSLATPAALRAHEDFLISHNGTNLVTGGFDHDEPFPGIVSEANKRVYEFDVEETVNGSPYTSSDPGFQAYSQAQLSGVQALPTGEDLSFRMLPITIGATSRNLWFWDGSGPVSFTSLGSDTVFQLTHPVSSASTTINGADDSIISGFTIDTVSSGPVELIHQHLESTLSFQGGEPAAGIYLASVDFELTGGLGRSEPVFMVYAALNIEGDVDEEMHEMAVDWVTANLLSEAPGGGSGAIPEPNSALLIGAGLVIFTGFRRKNRIREKQIASEG